MENPVKERPAPSVNSCGKPKLLRYALRSATKSKEEKPPVADSPAPRRGRPSSTLSKSMGVLDLSAKDKSARRPRRLSNPAKSALSPVQRTGGNVTPISETRIKRSANQGKNETPVSTVSSRKKFNVLSSTSYWLSQIKLSESAAKHSVSLGFFKLALEAGCEPLQRMRDELKSYTGRHNLGEYGEAVKQLFHNYNIPEISEKLQVSISCSELPEEGARSSNDDVHSTSSTVDRKKLELKPLDMDAARPASVTDSANEARKKISPASNSRGALNKNSATPKPVTNAGKLQKNLQKPNKQEMNRGKDKIKQGKEKSSMNEGEANVSLSEDTAKENKENLDAPQLDEAGLTEAM